MKEKLSTMEAMNQVKQALETAIGMAGGLSAFAEAVKAPSPNAVKAWKQSGSIPASYCPAIERETNHVIRCEQLRPDVDWAVLRGTNPVVGQQIPAVAAIKTEAGGVA